MSTILTTTAVAVTAVLLGGWAGYRLGTRRTATLHTSLDIAMRTATTDPLTGLPNRRRLTDDLVHLDRERQSFVLAIVNLDEFSVTNRRWGHRAGDQLLVLQAAQLRHIAARRGGTVYRLAADEFAVVWADTADTTTAAPAALAAADLAAGVLAALRRTVELRIGNRSVYVHSSATAGITISNPASGAGDPTSRVLRHADTALQHGKLTNVGTAVLWGRGLPMLPRPRRGSLPGVTTEVE